MVSSRVMGIDLHPVAVALARVTYLLAIGRDRLTDTDRGVISVPVYLGDSLGWDQREDLMSVDHLVIPTEVGDQLLSESCDSPITSSQTPHASTAWSKRSSTKPAGKLGNPKSPECRKARYVALRSPRMICKH